MLKKKDRLEKFNTTFQCLRVSFYFYLCHLCHKSWCLKCLTKFYLVRKQMLAVKINKVKQSLLTGSSRLRDFLQIGSLTISLHLISYSPSCSIKFTTLCSVVQHIVWTDFWNISSKFIVHVDYLSTGPFW